jgi:heparin binding hemagglutinin HbhA
MAQTTFKSLNLSATDLKAGATRPFYAGVGMTDLAVEVVREAVVDVQKRIAATRRPNVEARMVALRAEAKALPAKVATLVNTNVTSANGTYVELIKRGEDLVGRIRTSEATGEVVSNAQTTVAKAKTTKTQAAKGAAATRQNAAQKRTAATSSAKATVTAAKKTAAATTKAVADAAEKLGD